MIFVYGFQDNVEEALQLIHDVSTNNMGSLCVTEPYLTLNAHINPIRYDTARQKADLAAMLLQDLGVAHHNGKTDFLAFVFENYSTSLESTSTN